MARKINDSYVGGKIYAYGTFYRITGDRGVERKGLRSLRFRKAWHYVVADALEAIAFRKNPPTINH